MQTNSKIFDDFARLASGALGTAQGMKSEIDNLVHQRMEKIIAKMDLVPREEFDALKAMVVSLSETVEAQAAEIEALKKSGASKSAKAKTSRSSAKK
ncbi:accessory factor UbiK family protein [Sneathiella glossodoripedis]|uniref:accessory factor UbiK family protein n=1 Tax=Sneathiella glossodoripedis TaxID=418853 RepID=UPI0004700F13|nr:accessory factor UbiK family protein [Sneathiella glossodoripedis]